MENVIAFFMCIMSVLTFVIACVLFNMLNTTISSLVTAKKENLALIFIGAILFLCVLWVDVYAYTYAVDHIGSFPTN